MWSRPTNLHIFTFTFTVTANFDETFLFILAVIWNAYWWLRFSTRSDWLFKEPANFNNSFDEFGGPVVTPLSTRWGNSWFDCRSDRLERSFLKCFWFWCLVSRSDGGGPELSLLLSGTLGTGNYLVRRYVFDMVVWHIPRYDLRHELVTY